MGTQADLSSLNQVGERETVGKVEAKVLDMGQSESAIVQGLSLSIWGRTEPRPGTGKPWGDLVCGKSRIQP